MLNSLLNHFKQNKLYYLTFISGLIVVGAVYLLQQIAPFGKLSMLNSDFYYQYGPMLGELYDRLRNGSNLIYSFSLGTGLPFFYNYMNNLASPFNFILLLFKREHLVMAFGIIIGLRAICTALTMVYFLSHKFATKTLYLIPLAMLYSFGAYFIAYYFNIMWFDGLLLLPLITLGIEKLIDENKILLYTISLAVAIFTNYFIGYMLCLFSVLYFIGYLFLKTKTWKIKPVLNKCLVFAGASLLAGGLIAIVLIPLYYGLGSIGATADIWPTARIYYFPVAEFFANHFSGAHPTILPANGSYTIAPNIACGILGVTLTFLFIINKGIKTKIKIAYLGLLLIMGISFFCPTLDFIWHALHVPNQLPFRQSFIYTFILIIISTYSLVNLKQVKPLYVCLIYLLILILIGLLKVFNMPNLSNEMVLFNQILITIYFGWYLLSNYTHKFKKLIVAGVILTIMVECTISINHNWEMPVTVNKYYKDYDIMQKALSYIKKQDSDVYRLEQKDSLTTDDASWYNYYGLTTFNSMINQDSMIMHYNLGTSGNKYNQIVYKQNTPIYDLLFNLKYLVGESFDTKRYSPFYVNDQITVYKNNYSVGLMYGVNQEIKSWKTDNSNPFIIQNDYLEKATGIKDVLKKTAYKTKTIIYEQGQTTIIKYTFTNLKDNIYFDFGETLIDNVIINDSLYYFINPFSDFRKYFDFYNVQDYIPYRHYVEGYSEKFIINVPFNSPTLDIYICYYNYEKDDFSAYTIDHEKFVLATSILQENKVDILKFKEYYLAGKIRIDEAKTVYTSIPYDAGWQVLIDGKKVDTFKIGTSLLGFDIDAGTHNITLKYAPKGLVLGSIVSLSSLTILITIYIYKKIRR